MVKKKTKPYIKKSKRNISLLAVSAAIVIVCLSTGLLWYYAKYMPQVSEEDAETALMQYYSNLQELYRELNIRYNNLKEDGNFNQWDAFSKDWIQKSLKARPEVLDKRLRKADENRKQMLAYAHSKLIPLWQEYHDEIKGKNLDAERVNELKGIIEKVLSEFKKLQ
jgi:type II secretory pathway pseudopilin PulG